MSQPAGRGIYIMGKVGGAEQITLNSNNIPSHTHSISTGANVQIKIPVNTTYDATKATNTPGNTCTFSQAKVGDIFKVFYGQDQYIESILYL